MGGIGVGRCLAGGFVFGLVMTVIEWLMSPVWAGAVEQRLQEMGLEMAMPQAAIAYAVVTLLIGVVVIFFYAVATSHFGAGVRTALIVTVASYIGGFLPGLVDYSAIGIYPNWVLVGMGVQGLIEMLLGGVAGAWVYGLKQRTA